MSRLSARRFARLLVALAAGFVLAATAAAQDQVGVRVEFINSRSYPRLTAIVAVEDSSGNPILSLARSNFQVKIDAEDVIKNIKVDRFVSYEAPVHYYVVLTATGIMEGPLFESQKDALLSLVDTMGPQDTLSVYTVGQEIGTVLEATKAQAVKKELITGLKVSGDQPKIYDSLVGLIRKVEIDRPKDRGVSFRRVVLFFSDGRDRDSRFGFDDVVKRFSAEGLPIYAVGMRTLGAQYLSGLNDLAKQTGGVYTFAEANSQIQKTMEKLRNQISAAYVVDFKAPSPPADNETHQLMVKITDKNREAEFYKNFVAVKVPFPFWLRIALLVAVLVLLIALIVLILLLRHVERKKMGIGKRRCPDCRRRMKDDWEFCPFCAYLLVDRRRRKKNKKAQED